MLVAVAIMVNIIFDKSKEGEDGSLLKQNGFLVLQVVAMAVGAISQKMLLNHSKGFSILCLCFYVYAFSAICTSILYFTEWLINVREFREHNY